MKSLSASRHLLTAACILAISLSCTDNSTVAPPAPTNDVGIKETSLGKVLADASGKTLYFFAKDVAGTSTCAGGCLDTWPVFSKSITKLDPGLSATDFGSITRADGTTQTTYKSWPLYYYNSDVAAGDVKGENVGKVWFVAKPAYSIMIASAQLVGNDGKSYMADYKEGMGVSQFFVDETGRTLYGFANDKKNTNKYTKSDFSNDGTWPIYNAELKDLPSTIDKSLFSVIDVFGKKQLTYKGWPLYYFGSDNGVRGATKGVSVPRPGVWPIVNLDSPNAPE